MGVVPDNRVAKIEFYEAHLTPWTTNAAGIGLLPASVTALGALTTAARANYNAHLAAQAAAKAATQKFYDSVRAMHSGAGAGADMIQTIKTYAQTKNDPNVYVLAQITPPAQGGTTPPPGTPFDFTVGLLQDGSLELKWKCSNPSGTVGTIYEVKRRVGTGGGRRPVGGSAEGLTRRSVRSGGRRRPAGPGWPRTLIATGRGGGAGRTQGTSTRQSGG
jgi:hypothetical protein